jgi:hypothetical protein
MRRIILAVLILISCAQNGTSQPRNSNRQRQAQQPDSQPSPTPVNNRQAEIDNAVKAERERREQEREAKEDAFREEQARQNGVIVKATFWMAVFAGINLLVAIVYAFFAWRTLKAVDKQATHASQQVGKMGEQLEEMRLQRTTMRRQAIAAVNEARSTRDALTETKNLVKQNEGSIKLAKIGIEAAEKSAIYANRAYVVAKVRGVTNVSLQFDLWIQNLGNTPANNVRVSYAYGVREEPPHTETPENLVVYDFGFTETKSVGLIAPDGSHQTIMTPRVELSDDGDYERLHSKKLKLYCWGRINYEDIFNRKWHTDFCFEAWRSLRGADPCKHGNEAY